MRIVMAQINPTVGDLEGNARKIKDFMAEAGRLGSDLVVFPELAITGYPPQDLLYDKAFIAASKDILKDIVAAAGAPAGIVGFVDSDRQGRLYNAAAVFQGGKVAGIVHKTLLPTYDVFDEDRYFERGLEKDVRPVKLRLAGRRVGLGVEICEDLWDERYDIKVTDILAARGAELIVNISSSPFYVGKRFEREELLRERALKNKLPIFYVNLVGGQDELVFDGQSMAVDARGRLVGVAKAFEEDLAVTEIEVPGGTGRPVAAPPYHREDEMFKALVLGIRDYFRKTGFEKALIGLSGGIDSSVTACLAAAALGPENVLGLSLPARVSSAHSRTDARKLAANLRIPLEEIPIAPVVARYRDILKDPLARIRRRFGVAARRDDPVADENIQPRVRGNCLMDVSNRLKDLKALVLTTGNKTELALGYCTLYGDMTGGLGALGDVSKLDVYGLARHVNAGAGREVIPRHVLEKPASPELKRNQVNPFDFETVSPLVDEIIENRRSRRDLVALGYPAALVDDILGRVRRAEYKRWQAAPCIKISRKAFGIGWRMPIVNKFRG